jgi:hypothetical protein
MPVLTKTFIVRYLGFCDRSLCAPTRSWVMHVRGSPASRESCGFRGPHGCHGSLGPSGPLGVPTLCQPQDPSLPKSAPSFPKSALSFPKSASSFRWQASVGSRQHPGFQQNTPPMCEQITVGRVLWSPLLLSPPLRYPATPPQPPRAHTLADFSPGPDPLGPLNHLESHRRQGIHGTL